jgi:hypothetical protein
MVSGLRIGSRSDKIVPEPLEASICFTRGFEYLFRVLQCTLYDWLSRDIGIGLCVHVGGSH